MTVAATRRARQRRTTAPESGREKQVEAGARAVRVLVGGVNSPVRAFRQVSDPPVLLTAGRGAWVRTAEGARLLDLVMGWGALILGHGDPAVQAALRRALAQSTLLGLTSPAEIELAELICEAVPSVEQVRFTASGTEACLTAVRLARAATGRAKVVACEGGYHGHSDSLLAGQSAGIPAAIERETLRVPFNDVAALRGLLQREGRNVACLIVEPVAANMGVVPPVPGFLEAARQLTRSHGALLIFDEVVTGFRLRYGAAQDLFGVRPDLTTFGKIIGGGLPIGAVGGPRALMQRLAPSGDVYHAGTFAGHPLSMAAGIATLRRLKAAGQYDRLEDLSGGLAQALQAAAGSAGRLIHINRVGSMMTVFFSKLPVRTLADARRADRAAFARWANGLRRRGILVPPSPQEALFVSTAHTAAALAQVASASRAVWQAERLA